MGEIADDALITPAHAPTPGPAPTQAPRQGTGTLLRRLRPWLWAAGALIVGVPLVLTLISALTSPPHVAGVPLGRLVYLEADSPSEHTTTLRGLYLVAPGGASRLLVHETEPQDADGGVREWITQPALSPDGTRIAFEKQFISLQEERQSIVNQIWVMPLTPADQPGNLPHLVIDLTKQKMKQVVGLAWDSDSSLVFLQDGVSYSVATDTDDAPLQTPLDLHGFTLAARPDVSATRGPALAEAGNDSGAFAFEAETTTGPRVFTQSGGVTSVGPTASVFALSPTGERLAYVAPGAGRVISLYDIAAHRPGPDVPVRWGWSAFGKRRITSLRWSPDGRQIGFTVSKPPVPDDEVFAVDTTTGKTVQLPYRTGRAAWDWGK
jgi:dipeptidyl aminopeptidase/acylaminoacyl peptidase